MDSRRTPRTVLIVNPNAGRLPDRTRNEVVDAARARFRARAVATTARDTGIEMAQEAVADGAELVVAFGGDGHINEVANGVAGTEAVLGIVPGGTMNVFARALGIPNDPLEAIDHLARRLREEPRSVPLGRMDDRYFTFSAGCGFDAEAAERVERYVPAKRRFGEVFFYWSAFRVLMDPFRYRRPTLTLKGPFGEVEASMAIASNAGPYAYLFGRPIVIAPEVDLYAGIDLFALRKMRIEALPNYAWRCLVSTDLADHPDAFYARDLDSFQVTSAEPFSRHVDGEPLAPSRSATFVTVPDAIKVWA